MARSTNKVTMGKLLEELQKQLETEFKQDAEDYIKIYETLKTLNSSNRVWLSEWSVLTKVIYTDTKYRYIPSRIGDIFLKGIDK